MPGISYTLNEALIVTTTQNNFTAAQDITSSASQQPCTINGGTLKREATIHTRAAGTFSTTGTPTLILGPYLGTTALGVNSALTTASGAATLPWLLDTWTVVNTDGTSGKAKTTGTLTYGTTLTAITTIPIPAIALADVTIDTTVGAVWSVKATWSVASVSNIITCSHFSVEYTNMPA